MDGNASTPWWGVFDGTENIIIRDYDGSLTANKNTAIVNDRPFFTGIWKSKTIAALTIDTIGILLGRSYKITRFMSYVC